MPWDVFISHPSEDKEAVTLPLQAALERRGVSVWVDKSQIAGGQGLRASIDHGLANSRFAVVIASKSFFAKHWTSAELDAIFGQEAGEKRNRLIPVLHDITHGDVQKHSPLVAGRLMLNWPDGVDAVADSIRAIVAGQAPTSPQATVAQVTIAEQHTSAGDLRDPALLLADDGRAVPVKASDIRHNASERRLEMQVTVDHPDAGDFLATISRANRPNLSIAYGLQARRGVVESLQQTWAGGAESWRIALRLADMSANMMSEMSVNGISPDDIANRRARRILLNERPAAKPTVFSNDSLLESIVGRAPGGLVQIDRSPFSKTLSGKRLAAEGIAVAKLQAVMLLILSNTVEHIHSFDVTPRGPGELAIAFRGRRPRVYTNVDPAWINVEGECSVQ